ncbi:hypothetical protein PV726_10370 [Streptomyces europaeiscabiei]|uniref:hypothetical protein n=1 Tax=Streptomyces europaeiscabiei TaxID=146819 RepID=UPI0029BBEB2C|nr:hypothetical protein [Streptomyces europaeiscabiei]MDX3690718.1 hypothetical protein [Streptomyces europaeiscabiei]
MVNPGRSRGGSGEWEQPFWQQRGWVLSAGFLLVLLVLAAATLMNSDDDASEASGSPSPTASASDGSGGGDARPAGCRTDNSEQEKPTAAPKDIYWKAGGTHLVPVSKSAGPLTFDGPVWSCYAHTPMGAVFAAHAITNNFGLEGWREVVERQVVPGAGRDAYVAKRSKKEDESASGQPSEETFSGFSVLAYNEKEATVMILGRIPSVDKYGSLSVTLRWQDGDWKVLPDPDGTIYGGVSYTDGTSGFITWGT